ncbi:Short-chain collagen C4 (Fragment), partial [Geodia barretti]
MAEMVGREREEQREPEERPGCQETWERGGCQVSGDLLEYLVPGGQWGTRAVVVPLVWLVLKENLVYRVQQQEEEPVYTRWGRTSCPSDQGTTLVYSGRAGGSYYHHHGGAANLLCLPDDPEYSRYEGGVQGYSPLRGTEYQANTNQPFGGKTSHNIPCAVCCTSIRSKLLVIPAKLSCPTNWTTEYNGYLMAA